MSKSLDQIGIECGTDKASQCQPGKVPHHYLLRYDEMFSPLRQTPINLLEIGVFRGESVRMWLEYFPWAYVFGIDVLPNPVPNEPRYIHFQGDVTLPAFWIDTIPQLPNLDIVIDDATHRATPTFLTCKYVFQRLKKDGIYIVEDMETQTMKEYRGDPLARLLASLESFRVVHCGDSFFYTIKAA